MRRTLLFGWILAFAAPSFGMGRPPAAGEERTRNDSVPIQQQTVITDLGRRAGSATPANGVPGGPNPGYDSGTNPPPSYGPAAEQPSEPRSFGTGLGTRGVSTGPGVVTRSGTGTGASRLKDKP